MKRNEAKSHEINLPITLRKMSKVLLPEYIGNESCIK